MGEKSKKLRKKMKTFRTNTMIALAGLAFFLGSCASTAHVEKDETANFSGYKSYAWIDRHDSDKQHAANDLAEQKIRQAVDKELQKTGWRESKSRADILLDYDLLVERSTKQRNDPVYSQPYSRLYFNRFTRRWGSIYYPSELVGYDNRTIPIREGTITITMIDAKSDKTVWQGWATDEVDSQNMTSREIQNSVKSIFRKFDVARN